MKVLRWMTRQPSVSEVSRPDLLDLSIFASRRPYSPILTQQNGSYIVMSEVKAELGNFSLSCPRTVKRRVYAQPNSLR